LTRIKAIEGQTVQTDSRMNPQTPLELDVRPLFAAGRPPMAAILNAVNRLDPGQALRLIAPIEPVPLYQLLAERGFVAQPQQREDGAWEILFQPGDE
jgi:uncharacterized protein (DUF2249 family)